MSTFLFKLLLGFLFVCLFFSILEDNSLLEGDDFSILLITSKVTYQNLALDTHWNFV